MGKIDEISERLGALLAGQEALTKQVAESRMEIAAVKQAVASLQAKGCERGANHGRDIDELKDGYKKLIAWLVVSAAGTQGGIELWKMFM